METVILVSLLVLTFISRVFDGIEHGLHWNNDSSPIKFHDADLIQTWAIRAMYGVVLYLFFPLSISLALLYIGILMVDQAVWQIFLNRFAGNGFFSGELDEAKFSWWPTSNKVFANRGRIVQIVIGLTLILITLL
jgi:hypothetical protein